MPTPAPHPPAPRHPTRNSQRATRNYARAFTLTEILVVIAIIVVLVSILLPVVSKIRYAAYNADTQNEISQISNACTAYYSTFHAYPGPLSNDQTATGTLSAPLKYTVDLYPTYTAMGQFPITGAENLVLGLMGGLRSDPTAGNIAFSPTEVGLGPLNLNPAFPGRTPSFLSTGSTYLLWCETNGQSTQYQSTATLTVFTDPAGTSANDSPIPEFVDRFPTPGPLPILYLRARTGARGVISDGTITDPTTGATAFYQYDLRDIGPYVLSHIGLPPNNKFGTAVTHNLAGIGSSFSGGVTSVDALNSPNSPGYPLANAGIYFTNQSIAPTGADANNTGRPRAVDQFILISAGQDGVYGTADDITSFGSVSQ